MAEMISINLIKRKDMHSWYYCLTVNKEVIAEVGYSSCPKYMLDFALMRLEEYEKSLDFMLTSG